MTEHLGSGRGAVYCHKKPGGTGGPSLPDSPLSPRQKKCLESRREVNSSKVMVYLIILQKILVSGLCFAFSINIIFLCLMSNYPTKDNGFS